MNSFITLGWAAKSSIVAYIAGSIAHMTWAANRGGTLSVAEYNAASHQNREIGFITPFEAFWSGFKWNTCWTFLDSWIWPVKLVAFFAFLLQSQYMPQRLNHVD